ncbi:MAG: hypothetical protein DWP92_04045 [Armatimonadetes bacterium]|nr:MAG: hypothetical protein DWP92_04045 [Armatimonadota bacterium]
MNRTLRRLLVALTIAALAVGAAACDRGSGSTSTAPGATTGPDGTNPGATTTTFETITSIPPNQIPGTHSDSISEELDSEMRAEIGLLILAAEESRALPFLEIPTVTILDLVEFQARVAADVAEDLDSTYLANNQKLFELMGMLDGQTDLGELLVDLYAEQVLGFYDGATKEIVVPAAEDGFSAYQRITIVHELVHALTDQHFDFDPEFERRSDEGNIDDASALLALVEGDATYQQFLYIQNMDPAEAVEAALEALSSDTTTLDNAPTWVGLDLAFPYEQGLVFIRELIADGGLKEVDETYQDMPTTTEQILNPRKYIRREDPEPLEAVSVTLPGWEVHEDAAWGEWGVRMILTDTVSPGMVTQAAAGWGNDSYRTLVNGDDIAMAWSYLAETDEDAEDLVNALIVHARERMGATSSQESGGGLLLRGGGVYVFIDRMDDRFVFIASTDSDAGAALRTQMGV